MEVRLGLGGLVDRDGNALLFRESHTRWGFRPHLELAFPFVLSVSPGPGPFGQTVVAAGFVSPLTGRGDVGLSVTHALSLGGVVGIVGQMRVEAYTTTFVPKTLTLSGSGALLLRPCSWLFAQVGVGYQRANEVPARDAPAEERIVLGAALTRGLYEQPLVEVRLTDGLHLYESSRLVLRMQDLALVEHAHVLGLLLYF